MPILTVDDLANLPLWRVVMFNSNARPVIADALPHFKDRKLHALIERGKAAPSTPAATSTPVEVAARG